MKRQKLLKNSRQATKASTGIAKTRRTIRNKPMLVNLKKSTAIKNNKKISNNSTKANSPVKTFKKIVKRVTSVKLSTKTKLATSNMITAITKNGALVDTKVPNSSNYNVVLDSNGDFKKKPYAVTLNQTVITDNSNKFYIIQLLNLDNSNKYFLFTRWGRVGIDGQQCLFPCKSLEEGKKAFFRKYKEKTRGGYTELQIDFGTDEKESTQVALKTNKRISKKANSSSNLCIQVQDLMQLIFDEKIMNSQMTSIGYDAQRLPLGKLSETTLKEGYKVLKRIETELKKKGKQNATTLSNLSSEFYSLIPHNFGLKNIRKISIDTTDKLKEKLNLIDSLRDIEVATKIINDAKSSSNIFEAHYKHLNCNIQAVERQTKEFEMLHSYFTNSVSSYQVLEAYSLEKHEENKRFKDYGNKMLLWHGSRVSNFVGIISQGLRIAPPEAPSTGYAFGKGIYFADLACKSIDYCFASDGVALILLCEVSLGQVNELYSCNSEAKEVLYGKHSTLGCGSHGPDKIIDHKGIKVPIGKPKPINKKAYRAYNEYIVYDVAQVKLKYLLKLKY